MNVTYLYSKDMISSVSQQTEFSDLSSTLKFDRVVGIQKGQKIHLSEILNFIFHDRIAIQAATSETRGLGRKAIKPGWIHLGLDKTDLGEQKKTKWVRSISTILKHVKDGYEYMTYGTFSLSKNRSYWERRRTALNSVHAFVIDIDDSSVEVKDIIDFCHSIGLDPSFINATPRGFHVWFNFHPEGEAYGPHAKVTKDKETALTATGEFYMDLNKWLKGLFEERFNLSKKVVDNVYGGERYIRIPMNIVYLTKTRYFMKDFQFVRKELAIKHGFSQKANNKKIINNVISLKNRKKNQIFRDPAIQKLMTVDAKIGDRRNAAFTISLFLKDIGYSQEECITELEKWYNSFLSNKIDFNFDEVIREAQSAFTKSYKVSPVWIYKLTGSYPKIITKKKTIEERKNDTLKNQCTKFIEVVRKHDGMWETTTRNALLELNLKSKYNLDRIVDKLIEQELIEKIVTGKGRAASTTYKLIEENPQKKNEQKDRKVVPFPLKENISSCFLNAPKSYTLFIICLLGGVGGISLTQFELGMLFILFGIP